MKHLNPLEGSPFDVFWSYFGQPVKHDRDIVKHSEGKNVRYQTKDMRYPERPGATMTGDMMHILKGDITEIDGKHVVIAKTKNQYGDIIWWVGETICTEGFEEIKTYEQAFEVAKKLAGAK